MGGVRQREEKGEELAHQPPSEIPLESICEEEKEVEEEEEEEEEKEGEVEQKGEVDRSLMVPQWNPSQPHRRHHSVALRPPPPPTTHILLEDSNTEPHLR